jgi:hypothetical protein
MEKKFDFSGWATKANLKCSDGRIITKDAFNHCDGKTVPLVWGHQHDDPLRVLGHALLECRDDGVYTYGKFNDTEQGVNAKRLVEHGDVVALSIYANQLRQDGPNVLHGVIREVSLVLAGANPGAIIENVVRHSDDSDDPVIDPTRAYFSYVGPEAIELYHADEEKPAEEKPEDKGEGEEKGKTLKEVLDTFNEEQKTALYGIIGGLLAEDEDKDTDENKEEKIKHNESEGGNETMKQNVFDTDNQKDTAVISHADQVEILKLAKTSAVGSLQQAIGIYLEEKGGSLAHGIDELETLFPEFKNLDPGAPDMLTRDQGWVSKVMNGVAKSPFSRVRTRQADARIAALRAKGYKKGEEKTVMANIKLLGRQTEPQTIYIKDELNRDDIVDITDFSVVDYEKKIMRMTMNEEVATAIMVGDGREDGDPDKIHEDRIRPIWKDEDLYTIKATVDFAAEKAELQGTNTSANFSENYVYAEAVVKHLLYARENYKASGELEMYCDPHFVNVMLLARDLNGHRMYKTRADLAAALDVKAIHTAEQSAGLTRTGKDGKTYKLLALFVNLSNYQVGATKGGEITTFNQFDIDFNKEKFLMEARLSGALTEPYSAIALEELVSEG